MLRSSSLNKTEKNGIYISRSRDLLLIDEEGEVSVDSHQGSKRPGNRNSNLEIIYLDIFLRVIPCTTSVGCGDSNLQHIKTSSGLENTALEFE